MCVCEREREGGGVRIKNSEIAGTAFYFLRLNLYTPTQIHDVFYSNCPAAKQRRNDIILISMGRDDVAV